MSLASRSSVLLAVAVFAMVGCRPSAEKNTIYAAGYDEAKFNRIKPGDSGLDVIKTAGLPLNAVRTGTEKKRVNATGGIEVIPLGSLQSLLNDTQETEGYWIELRYSGTPSGEVRNYIRRNVLLIDGKVRQIEALEYRQ